MPDAILNNDVFSQTQNPAIDVDNVLGQILGVQLDGDAGRFRSALARAFPVATNAATGATSIRYAAPSYAVQSLQSGTIPATGALAGIQAQTSLLTGEALTVLARLRPLHCACDDGAEPLRDLIRGEIEDLPALFAQDAGPMSHQIDMTFLNLTGVKFDDGVPPASDPALVAGQIGTLRDRLGIDGPARTIDDEEIRTDFRIFVSYVWMLETAWAAVRGDIENAGGDSLGANIRSLSRRLLAVRYANADLNSAFDEARVGPAERMTFPLESKPPITLAELLLWIDEIASPKGLVVIGTGRDGIATIAPVVDQLLKLVCENLKPLIDGAKPPKGKSDAKPSKGNTDAKAATGNADVCLDCGDPTFLSTHHTKAAVNKLALQLTELCRETKRALQTTEAPAPRASNAVAPADNAKK